MYSPIAITMTATYSDHLPICGDGCCGATRPATWMPIPTPKTSNISCVTP